MVRRALAAIDFGLHVLQAPEEFFQGVLLHIGAEGLLGGRDKGLSRALLLEAVDYAVLRADYDFLRISLPAIFCNPGSAGHMVSKGYDVRGAFRMDNHPGPGPFLPAFRYIVGQDAVVGRTIARPEVHPPPRPGGDVGPQALIGYKEYLLLQWDRGYYPLGIAGGTADIALCLHSGGGVDVADYPGVGQFFLFLPQGLCRNHIGHRAAGLDVGHKYSLIRAYYGGSLCHEVYAAEDNHLGVCHGRLLGESEGITSKIRCVLDLSALVVMGKDDRP